MLASFLDVAENIGYPAVFVLIAIETIGIPVPGETALVVAAVAAGRGRLSIEAVIGLAAAAAIIGDNIGFAIGRTFGRRLLLAPGPLFRHRRKLMAVGEPFFDRHGPKAVFLGRWVSGLRITAAWLAGANRMSWPTFLFYNALGGIAWSASVGLLAYWLGKKAESILHLIGIGGLLAFVLTAGSIWFALRWRRRKAEGLVEAEADRTPTSAEQ